MKDLEFENGKLKRMYADLALENTATKNVLNRKLWSRPRKRQAAEILVREHRVSIARACNLVKLSRTTWYRRPASSMG